MEMVEKLDEAPVADAASAPASTSHRDTVTSSAAELIAALTVLADDYAGRAKAAAESPASAGIRGTAPGLAETADMLDRAAAELVRQCATRLQSSVTSKSQRESEAERTLAPHDRHFHL